MKQTSLENYYSFIENEIQQLALLSKLNSSLEEKTGWCLCYRKRVEWERMECRLYFSDLAGLENKIRIQLDYYMGQTSHHVLTHKIFLAEAIYKICIKF